MGKFLQVNSLKDCLDEVISEYENLYTNIVLITFKNFRVEDYLSELNILHLPFSTSLLTFKTIDEFLLMLEKKMPYPDVIIAIGGGVVLDTAKMLRYALSKEQRHAELVLIPSTAGTGSESTSFAVIYDDNKLKKTIDNKILLPDIIIHAPELLMTLKKEYRISSGFDALAQAIESLWSVHSSPDSRKYAIESISIINEHFIDHVTTQNKTSAAYMQKAAYLSGKAINISYTTLAHALSYPLTSKFEISHGLAVFLFIPTLIKYNSQIPTSELNDHRGSQFCAQAIEDLQKIYKVNSSEELSEKLFSYFDIFKIAGLLKYYGIKISDLDLILSEAELSNRGQNNPRKLNKDVFAKMLSAHFI